MTRQGEAWHLGVTAANATAGDWLDLTVAGVRPGAGPGGTDAVSTSLRKAWVPKTPESFSHDADGNLILDGRWAYTWDGENRLIAMETRPDILPPVGQFPLSERRKLEFAYDGQGRRVSKKVSNWSPGGWVLASSTLFLYDGWNMIAELNALSANSVVRTYVWGLDLSGSIQGAGGVGGLLFSTLSAQLSTHAAAFDGNGNVVGYVDMATGAKSATYEYSAFGETLMAEGVANEQMPFRFSTKFTESETGLLYYGLRYYNPGSGRWLSRDPIEEEGGVNLYSFVDNDGLNYVDILGLYPGVPGHGWPISPKDSVEEIRKLQNAADAQGEASTAGRLKGILPLFGNPDEFNTNDKNHFVYTCKYGWVDMGHFFRNAHGVNKLGASVTATGAGLLEAVQITLGRAPELLKRTRHRTSKSGFAVEDLMSNALGRQFGRDVKKQGKGAAVDIAAQWETFLKGAGAIKWEPGVKERLYQDMDDYADMKMPRAFTRKQGLAWMMSQPVHDCLCNGDVAREPANRY